MVPQCPRVSPLLTLDKSPDFLETWYERHATRGRHTLYFAAINNTNMAAMQTSKTEATTHGLAQYM
jgi:hypothetical protein